MHDAILNILKSVFSDTSIHPQSILHVYGSMEEFRDIAKAIEEHLDVEVPLAYRDPFAMGEMKVHDFIEYVLGLAQALKKTAEVQRGFEETFESWLQEKNIEHTSCPLSSGDWFWELTVNWNQLQEIKQLPYLYAIETTRYFYPS